MKKRLLSALLFTAALSLPATAQTLPARPAPEGSDTRPAPRTSAAEIDDANNAASPEEVSKKITRFEKILAALPKFSGYAQIGYTYQTNVGGTDGKNSSSFNVKRMRLILTGDISRTFDYKMQFEGFSSSADQQGKALITVQDMYLRAKIRPQIHIWAGQFPVPLTIENYDISPGTLEVPNFSHAILKMVCRNAVSGYNTYGRDCGLQATGAFLHRDGWDMLTYNLALFNGSQMNRSDDNKSKDIVARLTFFPLRELRISGSVNWGEYTNNTVSKDYIPMTRYAAGFWYDSEHILVRAEYAHTGSSAAYTDKTTGEKTRGKVDEQMYYLIAGYKFKGKYMPVIRYDVFNGKRNTYLPGSVGKQQDFLVGFLYMPIPRLKAQAAWTLSKYSAAGAKNGNGFEVALIGFFCRPARLSPQLPGQHRRTLRPARPAAGEHFRGRSEPFCRRCGQFPDFAPFPERIMAPRFGVFTYFIYLCCDGPGPQPSRSGSSARIRNRFGMKGLQT